MLKKLMATLLALSVMTGIVAGVTVAADDDSEGGPAVAWDGSVDQNFAGAGTANSPYLIETEAELAGLVTLGKTATTGKYYKMTRDMDVSGHSWYISGTDNETNVFNGTFDGAGYVVSGINISTGDGGWGTGCGLFPAISNNAHIKSVGIKNMNTDRWGWESSNGAIFGYANLDNVPYDSEAGDYSTKYPTIEYCYADESVNVKATFSGGIGGTVCGTGFLRISNCSFTGTFGGGWGQCAAIGNIYGSIAFVFDFYSTSSFSASGNANNIIKYFDSYTTSDGLGTIGTEKPAKKLTAEQMTGEAAKTNMAGFDFENVWSVSENSFPTLRVFEHPIEYNISFDLSAVEGAEVVEDKTTSGGKATLPAAPEGYHWLKGEEVVSGEITVTEDTVIKADSHRGGTATCKDKAVCEVCGESYGELSETHGEIKLENKKDATCSSTGYTGDKVCSVCGEVIERGSTIDKTAHNFENGVCTVCGETQTVSGDPISTGNNGGSSNTGNSVSDVFNSILPQTAEGRTVLLVVLIAAIYAVAAVVLFIVKKQMKTEN